MSHIKCTFSTFSIKFRREYSWSCINGGSGGGGGEIGYLDSDTFLFCSRDSEILRFCYRFSEIFKTFPILGNLMSSCQVFPVLFRYSDIPIFFISEHLINLPIHKNRFHLSSENSAMWLRPPPPSDPLHKVIDVKCKDRYVTTPNEQSHNSSVTYKK